MEAKHKCALEEKDAEFKWYQKLRLISPNNPLSLNKFRSNTHIRNEQRRHLQVNRYAIHPYSQFRVYYEIYLIYLLGSLLITKPIDAAFMNISFTYRMFIYRIYIGITDVLSWVDIIINFFTGVDNDSIELRQLSIMKHYVFRSYFLFDVLSACPKSIAYYSPMPLPRLRYYVGVMGLLGLLKIVSIISFIKYSRRFMKHCLALSQGKQFLLCSMLVFLIIVHWMACLQFAIPKLVRRTLAPTATTDSWFYDHGPKDSLFHKSFLIRYTHCLFKSSAYILGIRINLYKMTLPEEYILAIATYFIGKVLVAFIWIVLAVAILNNRLMHIRFLEWMNQLEEYMKQKQLPMNLRDRILHYIIFKFGKNYFKEDLVNSLLSENLKRDTTLHVCKSLVKNVTLFYELTPLEISKVVNYLIPEVYLANDIIIRAGTSGSVMYFISSGTVAVYTRSGREICHLQDGAYFGEIALVLKHHLRMASVIALESCKIYKLSKKDLERCLLINKTIRHKMLRNAERRLRELTKMEEEYKEQLFGKTFQKVD